MNLFNAVLYLHIACVVVSVSLFVLRYWWHWSGNRRLDSAGFASRRTAAIRCCFSAAPD